MAFVKGYKPTEEHRRRLSESHKGQLAWNKNLKGYNADFPRSEEWKQRISEGKKNSAKSTLASKANAKKMGNNNKGKSLTDEHKRKVSETNIRIGKKPPILRGENNPNWKGGIFEPYTADWTETLKQAIRERDDYTCQLCGVHQNELSGKVKKMDSHHIDYNKDNCNTDNLVSLCRPCHTKTNHNREYWLDYFNEGE